MTSKLTVYIDDSVRQLLKESAGSEESISKLVNDALESYMSASLVKELFPPHRGKKKEELGFPSLSEVEKRRPRSKGLASAAEIIANQRRRRNASLS
jgi:hypothetical protein